MTESTDSTARIPRLNGALNLRDMGGYPTADRRTTRWNRLYRSGTTHAMTDADLGWLAARGVRFAYDLRADKERLRHRNRLQDIVELSYRFFSHDRMAGDIRRSLRAAGARAEDTRAMMIDFYRELPYTFKDCYRALLTHLAEGDLPLVFNCTAGKDRTGVAAALILSILGVPEPVILEDYLLTAQFFDQSCALIFTGGLRNLLEGIPREVWEPLMQTNAEYLHAMFERLHERYGSAAHYAETELGLSRAMLERIRSNLLV